MTIRWILTRRENNLGEYWAFGVLDVGQAMCDVPYCKGVYQIKEHEL